MTTFMKDIVVVVVVDDNNDMEEPKLITSFSRYAHAIL